MSLVASSSALSVFVPWKTMSLKVMPVAVISSICQRGFHWPYVFFTRSTVGSPVVAPWMANIEEPSPLILMRPSASPTSTYSPLPR